MRRISTSQAKRLAHYHAKIEKDSPIQRCKVCNVMGSKLTLDRHHPKRRCNGFILEYIYVCRTCHDAIERGEYPEYLPRDNSTEQKFHNLKEGDNMLRSDEERI